LEDFVENKDNEALSEICGNDNSNVNGRTKSESTTSMAITNSLSHPVSGRVSEKNWKYTDDSSFVVESAFETDKSEVGSKTDVGDKTSSQEEYADRTVDTESEKPLEDESADMSYEKYPYSGQIKFDGLTFEKITSEIDMNGGKALYSDNSGLDNGYIPGKLSYKNDGVATHDNIKSDEKGHITFYMESEYDQHVNITFNKDGEQIAGYGIIPDSETTYVFGGFDPGEEYDIEISTSTGGTWMIESDYLLY